jgi:RND family efflux transporter MFP subunit
MAYSPLYSFTLIATLLLISNNSQANSAQASHSQKVTIESANSLLFYPEKKATALVSAINHAQVPAQISAQVSNITVQLGNSVKKGQVLVNLDCQDNNIYLAKQQSQYVVAKAQLHLAKRNFERSVQLKKNRHIGEAELDESEVQVVVATEQVAQVAQEKKSADLAVQRCQVLSPFDGIVSARLISEGDYVNTGQALVKVLETNNIEVEAQIPLNQIEMFLQAGGYYFITQEEKHPIEIKNIVDFVANNSRSQVVTFSLNTTDENKSIMPGMNGMVSWQSKRSFLPAHLLTQRQGLYGIFVTEKSGDLTLAKFIKLPDAQEGRPFELAIKKEQNIIVDGRHRVNDGTTVIVNIPNNVTTNNTVK